MAVDESEQSRKKSKDQSNGQGQDAEIFARLLARRRAVVGSVDEYCPIESQDQR